MHSLSHIKCSIIYPLAKKRQPKRQCAKNSHTCNAPYGFHA